jgi:K+/H+ antiporter YhaU regulatory subunit KhtT
MKVMRDVNYFIIQASRCTQTEFELDFVDFIEVFDTSEVKLTTEDGKSLIISFDEKGNFKSYFVNREDITAQMAEGSYIKERINQVIGILNNLTWSENRVDGETMQYILNKIGMEDQMLRQLMMSQPIEEVRYIIDEREELEEELDN